MQGRREDEGSLQIGDSFLGVPKRDDDRFILKIVSQIDYTVCGNHLGIGNCFLRVVPVRDHCGSNGSIRRFHLVPVKDYPQSCQLDIKKLEKSHFWCWTYTTIILVMARYGFPHLAMAGHSFTFESHYFRLGWSSEFLSLFTILLLANQIYRHINLSIAKKN